MAYFSNSSEGGVLDQQCMDCPIADDAPCPILLVQATYNYRQLDDGNEKLREAMNCLIDDKGNCQMKPILDEQFGGDTKTLQLFDS
ncbi:hypothetical protein [uncultured Paraglaciecola sp.]|uniref:hypothetical protein n=1 Tax=uncultured Paraglaciecola sp. TaxID=1765024 RepID=UPI0026244064|nr:hypothetical protein [uncultured Paraglaciecola sp.]